MYFVKTKKQFDQQEAKELQEKKDKLIEKQQKDVSSPAAAVSPKKKSDKSDRNEFLDEELPDGACFRPRVVASEIKNDESAVRPAEVRNIVKRGVHTAFAAMQVKSARTYNVFCFMNESIIKLDLL